jgi:hypothetical protein
MFIQCWFSKESDCESGKSKKAYRQASQKGFHGYPQVTLEYFGKTSDCADEVIISFTLEAGGEPQKQEFESSSNAREDEIIQTILVKIIERTNAKTVMEIEDISQ